MASLATWAEEGRRKDPSRRRARRTSRRAFPSWIALRPRRSCRRDRVRMVGQSPRAGYARLLLLFLAAGLAYSQQTTITVLATTDMHGNLFPVDYVTGQPAARGLAKVVTLIRAEEAGNLNHLLIDCGDTIQGTPLEYALSLIHISEPTRPY